MRVALVTTCFPEPSQTFVFSQMTGLLERGHSVDIYAYPGPGASISAELERFGARQRTFHFSYPPPMPLWRAVKLLLLALKNGPRVFKSVLRVLTHGGLRGASFELAYDVLQTRGRRYDVILCHFGPVGLRMQKIREAGEVRGPLVTVFHGYDMSLFLAERGSDVYGPLFSTGDLFLPVSEFWAARLRELGAPADRVAVHRMGVDLSCFSATARPSPERPFQIVSVARLVEKKGLSDGIRAFARLPQQTREKARYQIVGDGPLRSELQSLIGDLGLADRVRLLGWRSPNEIADLLEASHLLLAPSVTASDGDAEGIPVVLMEALARGLPVLSTLHSGIPELVEDQKSGYLVPERDVELLAVRLETLMTSSKKELDEMGRLGRIAVERDYDIEKLNDRLVQHLQRVAGAAHG
jgi:colanic acid/amylovoran/stewartan biosynthesis glycosyltransferase WcaL/AmsK/CpsK